MMAFDFNESAIINHFNNVIIVIKSRISKMLNTFKKKSMLKKLIIYNKNS